MPRYTCGPWSRLWTLLVALWLTAFAAPKDAIPTASAQSKSPPIAEPGRDRARKLAQQASLAFDRRDYVRARELLEEAHKIYPSPKLKYSLGRAYEAEGKAAQAMSAYQTFFDQVPAEERVPGQSEEISAAMRRLSRKVGRVQIRGSVGAWYQMDGGERQVLPGSDAFVEPGSHLVTCAGGELWVEVQAGATAAVYLIAPGAKAGGLPPATVPTRPLRTLKWVGLSIGVAFLVAGSVLTALDGQQSCDLPSRQMQCPQVLASKGGGIALLSLGGASLVGTGVLFYFDYRSEKAGHRQALLSISGRF